MVGAVTAVHATGAFAGSEARVVWALGGGLVAAALLSALTVARNTGRAAVRTGGVALAILVGAAVLGAALYGLDALVVRPLVLRQATAGSLLGALGAVILLAASLFPRRRD